MSYGPIIEGPIRAWKEGDRLEKEMRQLLGYQELKRQQSRHNVTVAVWMIGLWLPATWAIVHVLKLVGVFPQ
jgi:hypothetical protein